MEIFQALFSFSIEIMKLPLTIMGFTFSFWDVFVWLLLASIVLTWLGGLFDG